MNITINLPDTSAVERELLGQVLGMPEAIDEIGTDLIPEDFGTDARGNLWGLMVSMRDEGQQVSAFSVIARVARLSPADRRGLPELREIEEYDRTVPFYSLDGAVRLARRLRLAGDQRRLLARATRALTEIAQAETPEDFVVASAGLAADASDATLTADPVVERLADIVPRVLEKAQAESEGRRLVFIPTGIATIDDHPDIMGMSTEGVTLMLARSNMGKTSLINRLALGMALEGYAVYLHGTETSRERRASDMLSSISGVDGRAWALAVKRRGLDPDMVRRSLDRMAKGAAKLDVLPLHISGSGLTVDEVCARAKALHRRRSCAVVLVDYLQDLSVTGRGGLRLGDKAAQVGYSSKGLKDLAAALQIPVIVTAQVSGEKEGLPPDPRPEMWDCQWSSAAHQDAEEVFYIHNEDWFAAKYGAAWQPKNPGRSGHLELGFLKRRSGPCVRVDLSFDGPTKWVDSAREQDWNPKRALDEARNRSRR